MINCVLYFSFFHVLLMYIIFTFHDFSNIWVFIRDVVSLNLLNKEVWWVINILLDSITLELYFISIILFYICSIFFQIWAKVFLFFLVCGASNLFLIILYMYMSVVSSLLWVHARVQQPPYFIYREWQGTWLASDASSARELSKSTHFSHQGIYLLSLIYFVFCCGCCFPLYDVNLVSLDFRVLCTE